MKIAVAGKGGVGKTTVSGTLARLLARSGRPVVAIDADVNPMLGISLGLGMEGTERLAAVRQAPKDGDGAHQPTVADIVRELAADAPDGVRLLVASRMDRPDSGCACCGITPDRLLHELDAPGGTVIGDLEAGIGVVTRMQQGAVDVVLVVVNPSPKAIDVARRAADTAVARGSRVLVVANRVRDEDDLALVRAALGEHEIVAVPDDPAIARADEEGRSPLDGERGPGVDAISRLGERLVALAP